MLIGASSDSDEPQPQIEPTPSAAIEPIVKPETVAAQPQPQTAEPESYSDTSPTCGPIAGETRTDLQNVAQFCSEGIPEGVAVGAYAMGSLLWVKINYEMAQVMLLQPLQTEQLVKTWMKGWKKNSGSSSVTVYVEWKDTEVAKGETTAFSGDKVTLRK